MLLKTRRDVIAATLALLPLCSVVTAEPPKTNIPKNTGQTAPAKPKAAARPTSRAGIRLTLKFKLGDVTRYRTAGQMEAHLPATPGAAPTPVYSVSVDLEEEEKVAQVLPGGAGELAVSTVSGTGMLNGQPFTPPTDGKPSHIIFGPLGDLVSVKNMPENADMPVLGNLLGSGALSMHGVCLSAQPVRPGDSWIRTLKVAGMTGNGVAIVKSTYVREEMVGRYRTAHIRSRFTAPIHAWVDSAGQPTMKSQFAVNALVGTLEMTYDMNLAITEGKAVRSAGSGRASITIQPMNAVPTSGHSKNHPSAPGAGETRMELTIQLGTDLQE